MYRFPEIIKQLVLESDRLLAKGTLVSAIRHTNKAKYAKGRGGSMVPPSPMRIVFMALRHFVISSMARFFSEGTSRREMLSRTVRTRSCGVFGRLERLKRKDMAGWAHSANRQTAQTAEERTPPLCGPPSCLGT